MAGMELTADIAPNMPQEVIDAAKLPAIETESAIFFFGMTGGPYDCLNQWYPSHFHDPAIEGAHFITAEHYMCVVVYWFDFGIEHRVGCTTKLV